MSWNENHPEIMEGEMFITNEFDVFVYNEIRWKTKRMGKIAYDINGKFLYGWFPVFIQKKEYDDYCKGKK